MENFKHGLKWGDRVMNTVIISTVQITDGLMNPVISLKGLFASESRSNPHSAIAFFKKINRLHLHFSLHLFTEAVSFFTAVSFHLDLASRIPVV